MGAVDLVILFGTPQSKSAVRKAGKMVEDSKETNFDVSLQDDWRASQGYVLNTFQILIRAR